MAGPKPHLLYTKAPEGTETFKYSIRAADDVKIKAKANRVNDFTRFINDFQIAFNKRQNERNPEINIPAKLVSVEIVFFSWFNSSQYEVLYRSNFGLLPIKFYDLNTRVLFSVIDEGLFAKFIGQLETYINCKNHDLPDYNPIIRFIKDFKFHSTEDILSNFKSYQETIYLNLINNIELDDLSGAYINAISSYLKEKKSEFIFNELSLEFEIKNIEEKSLKEIARNFDMIHSINSNLYMITKPSFFGTNIKTFPFDITDFNQNLPTIGIIDTGVSIETPLSKVVINTNNDFGLYGSNPRVDEADGGYGHGTSVAALASLGDQLSGNIQAVLTPDANILSIKILEDFSGKIYNADVIRLIRKANVEQGIRLFNLTICYSNPLKLGDPPSDYAFLLDKLSYENDILICICTANSTFDENTISDLYPDHFIQDDTNFCTPADSLNNLTIGALGDNLEPELPITLEKYPFSSQLHPAVYTRKYHLDYDNMTLKNRNVMKPDVVYSGGNYTCINHPFLGVVLDSTHEAGLQVISASKQDPIIRGVGTSYSTPLVANIAAKISGKYPDLKPQTIKALIINNAKEIKLNNSFSNLKDHQKRYLTGYGKPVTQPCLESSDNEATIIFEDSIEVETVKSLPIRFPDYLNAFHTTDEILQIEATLCYRFLPLADNHLAYCPVNIAFGFFKNVPLVDNQTVNNRTVMRGISGGNKDVALFGKIWSQDAWARSKMLSNTQKMTFKVKKSQIVNEDNVFKVAVQSHFHKILPDYITAQLPTKYEYSLVIKIRESSKKDPLSNRLYSELAALNDLKAITHIDLDADVNGEVEID